MSRPPSADFEYSTTLVLWSDVTFLDAVIDRIVVSAEPAVVFASLAAAVVPGLTAACSITVTDDENAAFEIRNPPDGGGWDTGSPVLDAEVADGPVATGPGYAVRARFHLHPTRSPAAGPPGDRDEPGVVLALLLRRAMHLVRQGRLEAAVDAQRIRSENLTLALASSRVIGQAIGILMATHHITAERAFDLLRDASQQTHRKLRDLAEEVTETGLLDVPPPTGPSGPDRDPGWTGGGMPAGPAG